MVTITSENTSTLYPIITTTKELTQLREDLKETPKKSHHNALEMKWLLSPMKLHLLKLTLRPKSNPILINLTSFHKNSLIM